MRRPSDTYVGGESDGRVVPTKCSNNDGAPVHLSSAIWIAVGIAIAIVGAGALLTAAQSRRAPDLGRVSTGWFPDHRASKPNGGAGP